MTSLPIGSVLLDPSQVAVGRSSLDLNLGGIIRVADPGVDWGQAAITAYMADQQKWGSSPVAYRVPNRTVTIPLWLGADDSSQSQVDAATALLREKVALLQDEGGWLGRSSASGTNLYADVVNASLTLPDHYGEIAAAEPDVSLVLECLPDFYGDLVTLDQVTCTAVGQPVLQKSGVQAVIAGDYPGRAQLTVVDTSGQPQYGMLWGFRARNYSSATGAGLYYVAATDFVPQGGATVAALTGAKSNQAIKSNGVGTTFTPVAAKTLAHVGAYQVWVRCYSTSASMSVQAAWSAGDTSAGVTQGPLVPLPGANAFYLLNLGEVVLTTPPIGNAQWQLQVGGVGAGAAQNLSVDQVYLVPLDESAGYVEGIVANGDPVMLASSPVQLDWRGCWRQTAAASIYKPMGPVFGALPRIPPSRQEQRAVQLFVKPSRGDLVSHADASTTDTFTAQVAYRPSYLGRL